MWANCSWSVSETVKRYQFRDDRAPVDRDGTTGVHLALELAPELDRLDRGAEETAEGPFHHAFEAALEALGSHRPHDSDVSGHHPGHRVRGDSGWPAGSVGGPGAPGVQVHVVGEAVREPFGPLRERPVPRRGESVERRQGCGGVEIVAGGA